MAVDTSHVSHESRARGGGLTGPPVTPARQLSAGRALSQFALVGVLVLLLLGSTGLLALRHVAIDQSVAQAKELSVAASTYIVQPRINDALVSGDTAALVKFDRQMRSIVLHRRVVRVKLWTDNGTIVYSDDNRLNGRRFPLPDDERAVLRTGLPFAELSDLHAAENQLERQYGELLQVYTRVTTPNGQHLLFESYLRMDSVLAGSSKLVWSIVPAFMLALLALQVLQLPLAWRLVRRVQLGQREKEVLQRRAIEASDHERRRIARDLHDGLVQSLVGVSYTLAGTADRVRADGKEATAEQIAAAAAMTRAGVADLRGLIADIYPPSLESLGLRASIAELLSTAEKRGLETSMNIPADPRVAPEVAAALYRAAQEAVRNVIAHSGATTVHVELVTESRMVGVVVTDNGVGPDATPPDPTRAHFGLRLLEDLTAEVGGRLDVTRAPGGGTRFRFVLPSR